MKVKGSIKYKNSTALNENQIRELDSIVNEYLGTPEYSAEIFSGDSITFDSIEELLLFDNFDTRKIKKIIIRVGINTFIYIDCTNKFNPVYGDYGIDSVDKSEEFKRKFISILNKGKRNRIYEFFALSHYTRIFIIIWAAVTFYSIIMGNSSELKKLAIAESAVIIIGSVICGFFIYHLLEKINKWIKFLFPRLVLYIGEEKEKENRREKLRGNIFWVIFIGLLVSILGGLLPNIFR